MTTTDPHNGDSGTRAQRLGLRFNALVAVGALFAILVMANYLAMRHHRSFEWSQASRPQLGPDTLQLLRSLTNDVQVVIYMDADPDHLLYSMVKSWLDEYVRHGPRIKLKIIDYVRNPGAAKDFRLKYPLPTSGDRDMILFECNGRTRFVRDSDLSDMDPSKIIAGQSKEVERKNFKGEMLFTAAILNVSESRQMKAYFLQGHGEHDPDGQDDQRVSYSKFKALLLLNNLQVEKLALGGGNDVPADCQLLIVAGPRSAFLEEQITSISKYLSQGGRMLALLNYVSVQKPTGLESLLASWGVLVGHNLVCDPGSFKQKDEDIIVQEFSGHPVVAPLAGQAIYILRPRSVGKMPDAPNGPDAPKVEVLAYTTKQGFTKSGNPPVFNPAVDKENVAIPLMVAVERGGIQDVRADKGTTRIVVVGDSIFLRNDTIDNVANADFAGRAVNWLLDRTYMLGGIGPSAIKSFAVNLTDRQLNTLAWLLVVALPGGVLFCGSLVWFKRRR